LNSMRRFITLHFISILAILAASFGLAAARPVYAAERMDAVQNFPASSGSSSLAQQAATSVPPLNPLATATTEQIETVLTSTPNPDGSVTHEVQPGQSLWAIAVAYGITINDLNTMNSLGNNPVVKVGQKLMIIGASSPTVSPTVTETLRPPTRTPTLSPTPRPTRPTVTPSTTPTPTPKPLLPQISSLSPESRRSVGLSLVIGCVLGLVLVALISFLRRGK
jgi:LysM repeat protein